MICLRPILSAFERISRLFITSPPCCSSSITHASMHEARLHALEESVRAMRSYALDEEDQRLIALFSAAIEQAKRLYCPAPSSTSFSSEECQRHGLSHSRAATRETRDEPTKHIYSQASSQISTPNDESQIRGSSHDRAATGETYRESKYPWQDILRQTKQRQLRRQGALRV